MKLDLSTKVKDIKGNVLEMSFPTDEQLDALPKNEHDQADRTKLPSESVGNMLLNCLANYQPADKKEMFILFDLGQKISKAVESSVDLTDAEIKYLSKVIEQALYKETTTMTPAGPQKTSVGIYRAWGIASLLKAIGAK